MMKGDFTRRTFRSGNHFRGVLLQQGRVQLDADWNEQVEIQAHLDQMVTADMVGPHGGPMDGAGMAITDGTGAPPVDADGTKLWISAGSYYVGGILCQNEEKVALDAQPDLPGVALPDTDGRYVAYLDVWYEHITAVEQPALREVALGGPDTATRARTVWQLRLAGPDAGITCADVAPPWEPPHSASTGRLRARAKAPTADPKPCVVPASAGYRRLENQLYRVEIHDGSKDDSKPAGGASYVWSRDNGSVVARLVSINGNVITIDAAGRDQQLSFAKDQWVEVIDTDRVRRGEHGFLGRLDSAVDTELTVAEWAGTAPTAADLGKLTVVRRWDSAGPIAVTDGWVDLEDGVQVEFEPGGVVHTGDFWLIPARTANLEGGQIDPNLTGDVEWPRDDTGKPAWEPRDGITHRFAAVALLDRAGGNWTLVSDCRRLFPPLTELTGMEYAGGDGQEAMPADPLPRPLEVSVFNGTSPVARMTVRFTAADADGRLAATAAGLPTSTASSIDSATDANGLAQCFWLPAPDPARPSQQVAARLLGPGGVEYGRQIDFTAGLSIAGEVWFDPGTCGGLAGARTVQDAIGQLAAARSIVAVGGDGQTGKPGGDLALPVSVLVRTDCGPVDGAQVRFTVTSGAVAGDLPGLGAGALTVDLASGADGVASCYWRLGSADPVQQLAAELLPAGVPVVDPVQLAFTASLDMGTPGLHVTDVLLTPSQQPLLNDSWVAAGDLAGGIAVVLDGAPMAAMVNGKPVLDVTLDLPFPLSQSDQQQWGNVMVGTQPLTLAADVTLDTGGASPAVVWRMTAPASTFVVNQLFGALATIGQDVARCHLTLTGRAIADSADPGRRVVNGLALGRPRADGGTDLELPTVDDVRGADFTMWFWLVQSLGFLVMVPTARGRLRMKSIRDALSLGLPRDELRSRLPAGTRVSTGAGPDLTGARRAVGRGFRNGAERRLVIVNGQRYAGAAGAIRDSLGQAGVQVDVISADDPAAVARARTEAQEELDGVLTDDASAPAIAALGGFTEAIPL